MLRGLKKGGEGKGGEGKEDITSPYCLWRGEKNDQVVWRRTERTPKTLSLACHFAVPSLRDAPVHFTKQFGEVPNGWNVGSLHALDREECTVRANMHVTVQRIVRPISNDYVAGCEGGRTISSNDNSNPV